MSELRAVLATVDWGSFAAGAVVELIAAYLLWRFTAKHVRVLTGVVTVGYKPWKSFAVTLGNSDGFLLQSRGEKGIYRLIDIPGGKVTLTISADKVSLAQRIVLDCELLKPFAHVDFSIPLTVNDFGIASNGTESIATVTMVLPTTESIETRGSTASLTAFALKYKASVSARSRDAREPKTTSGAFEVKDEESSKGSWPLGTIVDPGTYRVDVSLDGFDGSSSKKDVTV